MSPPKFKKAPEEFDQHNLFATNVFDLLPKDHDCFIYEDIFNHIDTSEVEKQYHHLGQHAYHPRLIVSILIYAYSHGVFSSREIERRCHQDLAFIYIAQKNRYEPLRQAMNGKMATPEAKKSYEARKVTAEPAYGHIKNSGFRAFSLRGKDKVAGEFSLVCASYNFKKMVRAGMAGLIRLKITNRSIIAV